MSSTYAEFRFRAKEVIEYLRYVEMLERSDNGQGTAVSESVIKSMKASCFLLTYNMIEATAVRVHQDIFDHFGSAAVSFDSVSDEVKTFALQQLKNHSPQNLTPTLVNISTDMLSRTFESSKLFSGNVDSRKIRELARRLGYSSSVAGNGAHILAIKEKRNDLAHGVKTFSDVGREVTVEDLRKHVASAVRFLRSLVRNVESYIAGRHYLRT